MQGSHWFLLTAAKYPCAPTLVVFGIYARLSLVPVDNREANPCETTLLVFGIYARLSLVPVDSSQISLWDNPIGLWYLYQALIGSC